MSLLPAAQAFYTEGLATHGATPEALGWSSDTAQSTRFEVLEAMIGPGSVLDVGCGFGDFSTRADGPYIGVDMLPGFISEARRRYPDRGFICGDAGAVVLPRCDYAIASGLFITCDGPTMAAILARMWNLARRAVAFNLYEPSLTGPQRDQLVAGIVRELEPQSWSLRTDYLPDDLTLCLHK